MTIFYTASRWAHGTCSVENILSTHLAMIRRRAKDIGKTPGDIVEVEFIPVVKETTPLAMPEQKFSEFRLGVNYK